MQRANSTVLSTDVENNLECVNHFIKFISNCNGELRTKEKLRKLHLHLHQTKMKSTDNEDSPIVRSKKHNRKAIGSSDSEDETNSHLDDSHLSKPNKTDRRSSNEGSTDDDDDANESYIEDRCYSPATRRSIGDFTKGRYSDSDNEDELEQSESSQAEDEVEIEETPPTSPAAASPHDASIVASSFINSHAESVCVNSSIEFEDVDVSEKTGPNASESSQSEDEEAIIPATPETSPATRPRNGRMMLSSHLDLHDRSISVESLKEPEASLKSINSITETSPMTSPSKSRLLLNDSLLSDADTSNATSKSMIKQTEKNADSFGPSTTSSKLLEPVLYISSDDGDPKPPVKTLLQSKITMFSPKPKVTLKNVSKEYYNTELKKQNEIDTNIQTSESLFHSVGANLPDNGTTLKRCINELKTELQVQKAYVATLRVAEEMPDENAAKPKVLADWDTLSNALDTIQPQYTGKVGLNTFNTQKSLTIDRLKQLHSSLGTCPAEDCKAKAPLGLKVNLMDHQLHALSWMTWRENQKPKGGILADDMGLGKTLSMIALVLATNKDENSSDDDDDSDVEMTDRGARSLYYGGTLVVCPASLVYQWEKEVETRLKRNVLSVYVHHGSNRERKAKRLARYDLVLTTYAIVPRELKDTGPLFGVKWNRIVLDEAHIIRNHKSVQSESCVKLKGFRRWALTGTPIQNKEADLYAILKFLKCTPFDDFAVYKKFIGNVSAGAQERLNNVVQPLLLRRTKLQLQEKGALDGMPSKTVETVAVKLEKDEMNVYQRILAFSRHLFEQFLRQRSERDPDQFYQGGSSRYKDPKNAYAKMHEKVQQLHGTEEHVKSHVILTYILRLRQICCHPGLIDAMLEDDDGEENASACADMDLLQQLDTLRISEDSGVETAMVDNNITDEAISRLLVRTNQVFNFTRISSKFEIALNIVNSILLLNEKVIIVSQWTSVLNLLQPHLTRAKIEYAMLTGQVAVKLRNDIVVAFNRRTGAKVMLLSLTAGGVGLNLVGANHLLLLDPHWNPQLEAQAQDRIYRVGQERPVKIYKIVCSETIEERIIQIQEKKLKLANDILTGTKHSAGSKLTIDDMKTLFGM